VTLQDQEGGSAANLLKEFRLADFTGDSTLGTWTLKVSDRANLDSGTLNSWSITFGG
jgi:serine protease